jgi:hypothetical protein
MSRNIYYNLWVVSLLCEYFIRHVYIFCRFAWYLLNLFQPFQAEVLKFSTQLCDIFKRLLFAVILRRRQKVFKLKFPSAAFCTEANYYIASCLFRPHFAYNRPDRDTRTLKKERANFNRVAAGAKSLLFCVTSRAQQKRKLRRQKKILVLIE